MPTKSTARRAASAARRRSGGSLSRGGGGFSAASNPGGVAGFSRGGGGYATSSGQSVPITGRGALGSYALGLQGGATQRALTSILGGTPEASRQAAQMRQSMNLANLASGGVSSPIAAGQAFAPQLQALQSAAAEAEAARGAANLANEQRYLDILEQKLSTRDRLLGKIDSFGQGQRAQINQDYEDQLNSTLGNLAARGLASSSLDTTARTGSENARQLALGNLEDRLLGYRTDLERALEDEITGFQERKQEAAPQNANSIASLFSQLGGSLGPGLLSAIFGA